jgi:hypothetical protein
MVPAGSEQHSGNGKAYDVTPPPVDLTSPAVRKKSDAEPTETIHSGEQRTAMGAWKWALSDNDKQNASFISGGWLDDGKVRFENPSYDGLVRDRE